MSEKVQMREVVKKVYFVTHERAMGEFFLVFVKCFGHQVPLKIDRTFKERSRFQLVELGVPFAYHSALITQLTKHSSMPF